MRGVWAEVEGVVLGGTLVGLSDGELIRRFGRDRDERAFEALVARLGPMVLGVCRRELSDRRDVEDAFQATFLILARRASGLRDHDRVGAWVYGVSRKVSRKARAVASRRGRRERSGDGESERALGLAAVSQRDDPVADRIRAEVARLPEKFREPLQLCHLEGFSHAEAAEVLRASPDAIRGRLERARAMLRERLVRLGFGPGEGSEIRSPSKAAVPATLLGSTVRLALQFPTARNAAGAAILAREVLVTMLLWQGLKSVSVAALLAATVVGTGLIAGPSAGGEDPKEEKKAPVVAEAKAPDAAKAKAKAPPEVVTSPVQAPLLDFVPEGTAVKKGQVVVTLNANELRQLQAATSKALEKDEPYEEATDRLKEVEIDLADLERELEIEARAVQQEETLADAMIESAERRLRRIQEARADFEKRKELMTATGIQTAVALADKESEAEIAIGKARTAKLELGSRIRTLARSQRPARAELKAAFRKAEKEVARHNKRREEQEKAMKAFQKDIDACRIVAPADGVVVYATRSDEGGGGMMGGAEMMPGMMVGGAGGMPGMMGGVEHTPLGDILAVPKPRGSLRGLPLLRGQGLFWIWDRAARPLKAVVDFSNFAGEAETLSPGTKGKISLRANPKVTYDAVIEKVEPREKPRPQGPIPGDEGPRRPRAFVRILNPGPELLPGKSFDIRIPYQDRNLQGNLSATGILTTE